MENSTAKTPPENDPEKVLRQVTEAILKDVQRESTEGIGGWLFVPLAGLFLVPLLHVDSFIRMLPVFEQRNWDALTALASPGYHWAWAPVLLSELVINAILILCWPVLIILFLRMKRILPKLLIGYYLLEVIPVCLSTFGFSIITMQRFELSGLFSPENLSRILNGSIWAMIWIPYFIVSKRVKRTFIK
jgi:hypothetical protein